MKQIDIKKQPRLGYMRVLSITAIAIRYRLFRSLVTLVVIAVAIAFLMNIFSESLVTESMAKMTSERIVQTRQAAYWASRVVQPGSIDNILARLAAAHVDEPIYREAQLMGGLQPDQMAELQAHAQAAISYLGFFERLDYIQRRRLVHSETGTQIFDSLQKQAATDRFLEQLRMLKSVRFVSPIEQFRAFLANWPEAKGLTERVRQGRAKAIARLAGAIGDRTALEALTDADGQFGLSLRQAGFRLDEATACTISEQARQMVDAIFLQESLTRPEMRSAVAAYFDILPSEVNTQTLWQLLRHKRTAGWYHDKLKQNRLLPERITVDRMIALAGLQAQQDSLMAAHRRVSSGADSVSGMSERMAWLVLVSMLVCAVGIANAMLMSVTERFGEIATLKCLGALDGTIMLMFVMEAALLGLAGGLLGALLGAMIGLGRMLAMFGALLGQAVPFGQLLQSMVLSVVAGAVLAAIAAVYPSLKASRLAPMEAMRIE